MSSRDFDFLTLRKLTAYNADGSFVNQGYVLTTSTFGKGVWTNALSVSSINTSSIVSNNGYFSTLVVSSMFPSTIYDNYGSCGNPNQVLTAGPGGCGLRWVSGGGGGGVPDGNCYSDYLYWDGGFWQPGGSTIHIGCNAGQTGQNINAVAIGNEAGQLIQGVEAVAIGLVAGNISQGGYAVAIGSSAGQASQGYAATAIGPGAGWTQQGQRTVAIGSFAGMLLQNEYAVAIGELAGSNFQGTNSVAIGVSSAPNTQGYDAIAIGNTAAYNSQGNNAIAIGRSAAQESQGEYAVAIGYRAGYSNQHSSTIILNASGSALNSQTQSAFYVQPIRNNDANSTLYYDPGSGEITYGVVPTGGGGNLPDGACYSDYVYWDGAQWQTAGNTTSTSVHIGCNAGSTSQGVYTVAIGAGAGQNSQNPYSVAIGYQAGQLGQSTSSVAIGNNAGQISQSQNSVAIGLYTGQVSQSQNSVAIGYIAGLQFQGQNSVAIGYQAGLQFQNQNSVAIGYNTAQVSQGQNAVAIGLSAGQVSQGQNAVAIGYQAGLQFQRQNTIAIGQNAGYLGQGTYSIAIGAFAGQNTQNINTIVLNATGGVLDSQTQSAFYVKPIRELNNNSTLYYDPNSGEITYGDVPSGGGGGGGFWSLTGSNDIYNNNSSGKVGIGTTAPEYNLSVVNELQVLASVNDTINDGMATFIRAASTGYIGSYSTIQSKDYIVAGDTSGGAIEGPWIDTRYVYNPYNFSSSKNSVVWAINMSTNASNVGQNIGDIKFFKDVYADSNLSCASLINVSSINGAVYPPSGGTNYWTLIGSSTLYNNSGSSIGIGTTTPEYNLSVVNELQVLASVNDTINDGMATFIRAASTGYIGSYSTIQSKDYIVAGDTSGGAIEGPWIDTRYVYNPYNFSSSKNSVVWAINMSTNASNVGQNIGDIKFFKDVYADSNLSCSSLVSVSTVNGVPYIPGSINYWTLSGSTLYNNSGSSIGIGTTTPQATLEVSYQTAISSNVFTVSSFDNVFTIRNSPYIYDPFNINPVPIQGSAIEIINNTSTNNATNLAFIKSNNYGPSITNELGYISFYGTNSNLSTARGAFIIARQVDVASTFTPAELQFFTATSSLLTQNMTISSNGNVGIRTTTPEYNLTAVNMLQIRAGANDKVDNGMATFIRTASTGFIGGYSAIQTKDYIVTNDTTGFGLGYTDQRYVYNPYESTSNSGVWGINMSTNASNVGRNIGDIQFFKAASSRGIMTATLTGNPSNWDPYFGKYIMIPSSVVTGAFPVLNLPSTSTEGDLIIINNQNLVNAITITSTTTGTVIPGTTATFVFTTYTDNINTPWVAL